jgi:hypothetical protein
MRITDLPGQFEAFVDRARGVFGQEIAGARKVIDGLNSEKLSVGAGKRAAEAALAEAQAQHKQAQANLNVVLANLHRGSTLIDLDTEIAAAKKTLEGLKADIARETTAARVAAKQRADAERLRDAEMSELTQVRAERADAEGSIAHIRTLLNSFGRPA